MRLVAATILLLSCTVAGATEIASTESVSAPSFDPLDQLLPPPRMPDGGPAAEIVELPAGFPNGEGQPVWPDHMLSTYTGPAVNGYKTVLSGQLLKDLVIGPEKSPALIRGALVVPAGKTLMLRNGATLHIQADPDAAPPEKPGAPDPSKTGTLWLYGRLLTDGLSGARVKIVGQQNEQSGIFFYGAEASELRGTRMVDVSVTQASGTAQWLGCEFIDARHYALAGGACIMQHCTVRNGGGMMAVYDRGPWSLMIHRCAFEGCWEGIVMGSNPGSACLHIRENNFNETRGANLRAMPLDLPAKNGKERFLELLVGENWYGTAVPEQIDARIVDRRTDANLRARINTRPPAETAYPACGAHVDMTVLARTYKELEPARALLLKTQAARVVAWKRQEQLSSAPQKASKNPR